MRPLSLPWLRRRLFPCHICGKKFKTLFDRSKHTVDAHVEKPL